MQARAALGVRPAYVEEPLLADGAQGPLVGILTLPTARPRGSPEGTDQGTWRPRCALLIVAGQPQTRVGAHRMFVSLARGVAEDGVASLRFDCGGWGDSPGDDRPFEESGHDITVAAKLLRDRVGPQCRLVVLGLCDGASATILALPSLRQHGVEPDVLCLVNPWARNERTHNEAMLKKHYGRALWSGRSWRRLLTGRIGLSALKEPLQIWRALRAQRRAAALERSGDLPSRLAAELGRFDRPVWTVLSGDALVAAEVESLLRIDSRWRALIEGPRGCVLRVPGADHTMSEPAHWEQAVRWIGERCRSTIALVFAGALSWIAWVD